MSAESHSLSGYRCAAMALVAEHRYDEAARRFQSLATALSLSYPDRFPGSVGALQAAAWYREQLAPYGLSTHTEPFTAVVPGLGRLHFENLVTRVPGRSAQTIVVMAHRDDDGTGPGAVRQRTSATWSGARRVSSRRRSAQSM